MSEPLFLDIPELLFNRNAVFSSVEGGIQFCLASKEDKKQILCYTQNHSCFVLLLKEKVSKYENKIVLFQQDFFYLQFERTGTHYIITMEKI